MKNNWKEEYYNWQWTTKPSDDAGNFYPNRTNLEIAEWWIDKLAEQKKELMEYAQKEVQKRMMKYDSKDGYSNLHDEIMEKVYDDVTDIFNNHD